MAGMNAIGRRCRAVSSRAAAVHGHLAWLGVVAFEQVAQCSGLFGVLVDPSVASGAVVRAAHVDDVRWRVPFGVAVSLAAAFPVVVAAAGPFAVAQVSVADDAPVVFATFHEAQGRGCGLVAHA